MFANPYNCILIFRLQNLPFVKKTDLIDIFFETEKKIEMDIEIGNMHLRFWNSVFFFSFIFTNVSQLNKLKKNVGRYRAEEKKHFNQNPFSLV